MTTTPIRTAIVTGGAQGIGRGIVERLLGDGWAVAALDLDGAALRELAAAHAPRPLLTYKADVGDEASVRDAYAALADWTRQRGDPPGLDLLVSNAGLADPVSGPIERLSLADWRKWQDSHLTGAFLMVRAAIPLLRERRGSIVLIASTRALQSEPDTEAYAAAKGGLVALAHALAVSLGPDIRANAILPGWIETGPWAKSSKRRTPEHRPIDREQHPVGRVGTPEDIAATVAFLAGDGAGFITGQQIVVDGGMTRKMIYAE
ncbi:SDR family oxidoreductase [Sphingomonas turrisvirgatae]|uniref:Short-chain dehydrogenase n=1 Tax=Sphingomonas turrisvirgatae TaxID=1888892 RepID=A0A1E3LV65_9SPHN|nr:SDR family oxidoreductase [Sphingomonas turrisvirgatae]ODP37652.1 short-chain dehydrogenase [Sphingomonas turrisvirgatae]